MKHSKFFARIMRILKKIARKLRIIFKTEVKYCYDSYSILLPADHMLPEYQSVHPNYDRFLPHLVKHLEDSELVVDIGANVGDTLAAMYQVNKNLCYICIEPDDVFFKYLSENIERIKTSGHRIDVTTIQALVGKSVSASSLEGRGGTKHAVIAEAARLRSETLDKLIDQSKMQLVRLLKTDVDGFDWDVLDSSTTVINKSKSLLYFELQYEDESQYLCYINTIDTLVKCGYTDWFIFDNFGSFLLKTEDIVVVKQLMLYVLNQNIGKFTRTIYYFDVLAVQKQDVDFIGMVLKSY